MLDTSPDNLLIEIQAAEKLRDEHLESLDDQIARYHGPAYRGKVSWEAMAYDPKNRAYQYVSQVLPMLVYDNPRFIITSKRGPAQRSVADALRRGMNRWAVDTNVQEVAEQLCVDSLFAYGVAMVVQAPSPLTDQGEEQPRMRPQMLRLSPSEYGLDPLAKDVRDARFQFHVWFADKDDLLKRAREKPEEGWNADVIEKLTPDTGLEKLGREKGGNTREEIVAYSVWVPEEELPFEDAEKKKYGKKSWKDAGFNGTIRTIAVGQAHTGDALGEEIREPRAYYGPSSGPYQIIGLYYVPDSSLPLGPLTGVEAQNQELNQHARVQLRSAARRKSIGIVGGGDNLLASQVKEAQDGDVVVSSTADFQKNWIAAELGGVTAEQRLTLLDLEANLDNALGTSDALRGYVSGVGTATENAIANQATSSRIGWNQKKYQRGFGGATKKVAYYLYHDDRVAFPVDAEDSDEIPMEDPWFQGGTFGEGSGYTFEDLDLDIDAESMSRPDEAHEQQKATQVVALLTQLAPMMGMYPNAGWDRLLRYIGDAFTIPDLAELIDAPALAQDAQAAMQQQQPQQTAMPAPQPRMARDVGQMAQAPPRRPQPKMAESKRTGSRGAKQMVGAA